MALAAAFFDCIMNDRKGEAHVVMTVEAQLFAVGDKEASVVRTVRFVAFTALTVFHRRMNRGPLVLRIVAIVAQFGCRSDKKTRGV